MPQPPLRIVSFALELPYEGVPHAGGEYYLRHVQALLDSGHQVHLIAPETPENLGARDRAPAGATVQVVAGPIGARGAIDRLRGRLHPIWPPAGFIDGARSDPGVAARLRTADLVEFQWTHVMQLRRNLVDLIPRDTALVGFAHDVVTQGFDRRGRRGGGSLPRVALARLRARQSRRQEPRLLDGMDAVLVFSAKDRALLEGMGVRRRIEVVRPPLAALQDQTAEPAGGDGPVLLVGAFNRDENVVAAEWLLDAVWPAVLARHPGARLRIVGAHPPETLRTRVATLPSVDLTGYVDDLAPEYRAAAAAVIPLQHGAGVKFKTITAMAWGLPIVSTTIGVEGVLEDSSGEDLGLDVADDPAAFAAALSAVLVNPAVARSRAEAGQRYARRTFGLEDFTGFLDDLYADIAASRTR